MPTKTKETTEKKPVKKTVKAPAVKTVSKTVKTGVEPKVVKKEAENETVQAEVTKKSNTAKKTVAAVTMDVFGLDGKITGKITLPGEMFHDKVNKVLLAQAVRVYLANQRQGNASTKTRGEVEGSTRKIYRQKGTGRARHGSVRAPIFVKGGVVFGPKPRDFSLSLPQKMKRKALFSALSAKVEESGVTVIEGLTEITPKTKVFLAMLKSIGVADKKQKLLFITAGGVTPVLRAGRNVQGVKFLPSKLMNAYEVLSAKKVILMKDAVDEMKEHFLKK